LCHLKLSDWKRTVSALQATSGLAANVPGVATLRVAHFTPLITTPLSVTLLFIIVFEILLLNIVLILLVRIFNNLPVYLPIFSRIYLLSCPPLTPNDKIGAEVVLIAKDQIA